MVERSERRVPAIGVVVVGYLLLYLTAAVPTAFVPAPLDAAHGALRSGLATLRIFPGVPIFSNNGASDEKQRTLCALIVGRTAGNSELLYSCPEPSYAPVRRPYDQAIQVLLTESMGQSRSSVDEMREQGAFANAVLAQHFCLGPEAPERVYVAVSREWVSWATGARREEVTVEYGWSCTDGVPVSVPTPAVLLESLGA